MALKPCKECKQQVSTSAKTCPHCGVSKPTKSGIGLGGGIVLTLVVLGVIGSVADGDKADSANDGLAPIVPGKSKDSSSAPKPTASAPKEDPNCNQSLQCWGDKHLISASVYCADHIERLAKFSHEWTDGFLEQKMSHFRWLNKEVGTLTYIGDKIRFQNGFGAWQNVVYECDFEPNTKSIIDVRAAAGRL